MNRKDIIFGIYPVLEALKSSTNLDKIYIQKNLDSNKIEEIIERAEKKNITINMVPQEKLERLTRSNHQGVVCFSSPVAFKDLETTIEAILIEKEKPLFLLLDQISDVRNFGAIIRTAECTGVDAIIIPKSGGAPVSGDTIKTSAGAIFSIPICKVDHIKDAIFYLKASGIIVVGASEKGSDTIYDIDFNTPVGLVMGSEEKGITKSILPLLDKTASLPLLGSINSLNVSVACGAFLYEIIRQRTT